MNDTLNLSRSICPALAPYAAMLIRDAYPRNLTFDDKYSELAQYACQYGFIVDLLARTERYGAIAKWIAFFCGVFGCTSALITFTRKEYASCVTMIYHRSINAIEIFTSLITLHGALQSLYSDQLMKSQIWAYFTGWIVEKLRNVLFLWVNLTVLWIAIERILACKFMHLFDTINRKSIAVSVIVIAGITATCVFLPYGFIIDVTYDNETSTYKIIKSDWSNSPTGGYKQYSLMLSILMIAHALLLLFASLGALIGLVSMAKRKKALAAMGGGKKSEASRELLKQCSMNVQLCILQMCETVPCIANELLFVYITVRYDFMSPFKASVFLAPQSLTYDEARANANAMVPYLYLAMINGIGALISHYCRFYWYIIFSPRIRRAYWALVSRRGNQISVATASTKAPNVTGRQIRRIVSHV